MTQFGLVSRVTSQRPDGRSAWTRGGTRADACAGAGAWRCSFDVHCRRSAIASGVASPIVGRPHCRPHQGRLREVSHAPSSHHDVEPVGRDRARRATSRVAGTGRLPDRYRRDCWIPPVSPDPNPQTRRQDAYAGRPRHELQHAVEVALAPEVRDSSSFYVLFNRIGVHSICSGACLETTEAMDVQRRVAEDLKNPRAE